MRRVWLVVAGVCAALSPFSEARADTVVLAPAADTTLYSEDGDGSNGAGDHLFTGRTNEPNVRRALLRFDLSSIPAGSTITSVTLSLYVSRAKNGNARATTVHRLTGDWGEAGSDAPAEEGVAAMALAGDATWTYGFYPTVSWTDPGGDFVASPSATTAVAGEGVRYAWTSATMAADVQGWVDAPASNFGWILLGDEATLRSAKRFDSRDNPDVSRRPELTVVFTPPGACCASDGTCALSSAGSCAGTYQGDGVSCASVTCPLPSGACCAADGGCAVGLEASCSGTYQGDATSCSPNPCPVPTGACCDAGSCSLVDHPGTSCGGTYLGAATLCSPNPCTVPTGACCAADGGCSIVDDPGGSCAGTYEGSGTTCSPGLCPQPTGACCESSGACAATTQAACVGVWQGSSSSCSPNPCPQPTGACCAASGGCSVSTAASCAGTYQGDGALCSPNPCPQPTGACCATDGSCGVSTNAACAGAYEGDGTSCSPNPCPQPTGACCSPDASCVVGLESSCVGEYRGDGTSCTGDCPLVLTPYVDPLPIPVPAVPVEGTSGGAATYSIAIRQITQQLHRDLPASTVWVYDDGTGGSYPGPTIEARTDEPVEVVWTNDLRGTDGELRTDHILPVDSCPHGAAREETRVVTHLHGGHVAAAFDGHPDETILPGESVTYQYPNWQDASTIWYHDHALGITRLNVYAGLAALYVIRDDVEDALELPEGEYEVPLVIQDRSFAADGSLRYPAAWQEHFFGDVNLVNGKVMPYLEVDQGLYRFRLLNGANSRTYRLTLSGGLDFTIIGVDGGLLEEPVTVSELTLGGAERADVLVDFSGLAEGTEVLLTNSAPAPFPGTEGVGVVPEVMQFRVTADTGHTAPIPTTLRPIEPLDEADSVIERDFELRRDGGDECGGRRAWLINGLGWDDITERPQLGSTEVWRFINRSGVAHPMHMHLVFFQVLDRQPFDQVDGEIVPIGEPVAPEPWERGFKDTVTVGPNEIVRVIARFEDFVGAFPYHCHILEHEDHEMMRQFVTETECGDGVRGLPDEACDDGNTVDGDGCSATCTIEGDVDGGASDAGSGDASIPPADGSAGADAGTDEGGDGGCGCRVLAAESAPGGVLLALLTLVGLRRRRRS